MIRPWSPRTSRSLLLTRKDGPHWFPCRPRPTVGDADYSGLADQEVRENGRQSTKLPPPRRRVHHGSRDERSTTLSSLSSPPSVLEPPPPPKPARSPAPPPRRQRRLRPPAEPSPEPPLRPVREGVERLVVPAHPLGNHRLHPLPLLRVVVDVDHDLAAAAGGGRRAASQRFAPRRQTGGGEGGGEGGGAPAFAASPLTCAAGTAAQEGWFESEWGPRKRVRALVCPSEAHFAAPTAAAPPARADPVPRARAEAEVSGGNRAP